MIPSHTRQAARSRDPEENPAIKHPPQTFYYREQTCRVSNAQQPRKKFDKDGDGTLSKSEREAARAAMKERHAKILEQFDKDGDGTLSEEERAAAKAAHESQE